MGRKHQELEHGRLQESYKTSEGAEMEGIPSFLLLIFLTPISLLFNCLHEQCCVLVAKLPSIRISPLLYYVQPARKLERQKGGK